MSDNPQVEKPVLDKQWLYSKGWLISEASKVTGRSVNHISSVLRGDRYSKKLLQELKNLPCKKLNAKK